MVLPSLLTALTSPLGKEAGQGGPHSPWHSRVLGWAVVPSGQEGRHFPLYRRNRLLHWMQKSWLKQLSHVAPHSARKPGPPVVRVATQKGAFCL